ncbi:UNVERIFIED_CONTAM: hypothetical protein FKN15_009947 [Acipenser sinensis]
MPRSCNKGPKLGPRQCECVVLLHHEGGDGEPEEREEDSEYTCSVGSESLSAPPPDIPAADLLEFLEATIYRRDKQQEYAVLLYVCCYFVLIPFQTPEQAAACDPTPTFLLLFLSVCFGGIRTSRLHPGQ